MNTRSASEGIVWMTPAAARMNAPEPGPTGREDAKRDRDQDRRRERDRHQREVLAESAEQPFDGCLRRDLGGRSRRLRQEIGRDPVFGHVGRSWPAAFMPAIAVA